TVKITIHTTSTKCQYRPAISTTSAFSCGSLPRSDRFHSESSITMPSVTWTPWNPVSTKKLEPKGVVLMVRPSRMNEVNSYTWPEMNVAPRSAVASSHTRRRRLSPRWMAASASTIVSELISSTNELTDV